MTRGQTGRMAWAHAAVRSLFLAALGVSLSSPQPANAQASPAPRFDSLLHAMGDQAAQQTHLGCDDWGWDPLDSGHVISLCTGQRKNTLVRVIRTKIGRLIAVTREVGLSRADAQHMLYSLRDSLSRSLGLPDSCRFYSGTMKRSYTWHSGSYSVLLDLVDPGGQSNGHGKIADASVGLQAATSTLRLDCDNWIPGRI